LVSRKVTIQNARGIHVRPAGVIVASVQGYSGTIEISTKQGKRASLQSILSLLSLGLASGDEIILAVNGPEEEKICSDLVTLLARNFDFPCS